MQLKRYSNGSRKEEGRPLFLLRDFMLRESKAR